MADNYGGCKRLRYVFMYLCMYVCTCVCVCVCMCMCVYVCIQCVPGEMCQTSGGCSLC